MWSPSALSSSPGVPGLDTDDAASGPAQDLSARASDRLRGVDAAGLRGDPIAACRRALASAQHLSPATRAAALEMLSSLAAQHRVQVPDADDTRKQAVAGIQWAMETTLEGTEVIVTPERATPLRTIGDAHRPEAQRVRADALQARFHRGDPLHLVFCRDGQGTPQEDAAYRRAVLDPAREQGLPLKEHVLPLLRAAFPPGLSGAFIVSAQDGGPVAFAIRAAQADKIGTTPCLTLWWGDPNGAASHEVFQEWGQFLETQTGQSLGKLIGTAAAPLPR